MKIEDLDKNFKFEEKIYPDIKFYSVREDPFKLYGLFNPQNGEKFLRMPEVVARSVSEGVFELNKNTAGGRVRFKTNSKYVALRVITNGICVMHHMPINSIAGFDMYVDGSYYKTFSVPDGAKGNYETSVEFKDEKMRDILINFPLYNDMNDVLVGLSEKAQVLPGGEYKIKTPVVFYGSSITQGACASRPGNAYQAVLSRRLDFDFINLGFSGNAKGESEMAEFIAGLSMSAFVYDYDHNAPTVEHLRNTHYPMYKIIRDQNPSLPIIMASYPVGYPLSDGKAREEVIKETYNRAVSEGDKNAYYVSGFDIFNAMDRDMFTVDDCHPGDVGMLCMAQAFEKILKKVLD